MSEPGKGPAPQLALGKVLVGAAVTLAERRQGLLRAVALPAVVQLAYLLFEALAPAAAEAAFGGVAMLLAAMHIVLAVNVQRLVLLGSEAVPATGIGGWGLREWRYLGWWWLQWLAASFVVLSLAPLGNVAAPGYAVAVAAGAWVAGRMSLVLPGIAIDRSPGFRSSWLLGQGAGARLAVLAVGVPLAGLLVLLPLGIADVLPVRLFGALLSVLLSAWSMAALALAWQALNAERDGGEAVPARALGRDLKVEPDALRGVLGITVPRRLEAQELELCADIDDLGVYRGRLRGVVLEVGDEFSATDTADWSGLDALLSLLAVVQVHEAQVARVALLAPTAWAPGVEALGKHFGRAQVRYFPALRRARAAAWASGEDAD